MRLSGGVAILGEGPDPRDAEARGEEAGHPSEHEEVNAADAELAQDDAGPVTGG